MGAYDFPSLGQESVFGMLSYVVGGSHSIHKLFFVLLFSKFHVPNMDS